MKAGATTPTLDILVHEGYMTLVVVRTGLPAVSCRPSPRGGQTVCILTTDRCSCGASRSIVWLHTSLCLSDIAPVSRFNRGRGTSG